MTGKPRAEKPHHPHWPLSALVFAFVCALAAGGVHEPSTWLHIASGARIAAERALPAIDSFSYTVAGRPWTTDSWLVDLLFWIVDSRFGPQGLLALKAVVLAAGFSLLLPVNPASPVLGAALLSLGAAAAWRGFSETPAIFDFLMLALLFRLLRPRGAFRWRLVGAVAAVMLLWANLHGSAAALGLWFVALKAFKASLRAPSGERRGYAALFVAAALALAANPLGPGVVAHMFSEAGAAAGSWKLGPGWDWGYVLFALGGALGCWACLQQEFFLTIGTASLLGLSLIVEELRPLYCLAASPVIALALGHYVKPWKYGPAGLARWALFAAAVGALYWTAVAGPLPPSRGYGALKLDGAIHFIKANGVRGRMFNEIESGPALAAAGLAVFVDTRARLYGPAFMRDAMAWPGAFASLAEVYAFDYAVVLNRRAGAPARSLDESPQWSLLYADDAALVYARRNGASGWLAERGGAALRPNRLWPDALDEPLSRARSAPRVLDELDRWIVQAPDAAQPLIWKAYALDRLKLDQKAARFLSSAESRFEPRRDPELAAMLAFVYERRGEPARAERLYRRASLIARRRGERGLDAMIQARLVPLLAAEAGR